MQAATIDVAILCGNGYSSRPPAGRKRVIMAIRCSLAWLAVLALTGVASAQEPPHRIVSANLCTDQLVLALADPGQIASLSPFARDRDLSFLAERAAAFPMNRGTGEDIFRVDADL